MNTTFLSKEADAPDNAGSDLRHSAGDALLAVVLVLLCAVVVWLF
jgi:hypothetical protein